MNKIKFLNVTGMIFAFALTGCANHTVDPWKNVEIKEGINLYNYVYDRSEDKTVDILIEGYGPGYSIGIYDRDSEPGSAKGAIKRKAIKQDIKVYSFELEDFRSFGEFSLFLFDKNEDIVKDFEVITILDTDDIDYGAISVSLEPHLEQTL